MSGPVKSHIHEFLPRRATESDSGAGPLLLVVRTGIFSDLETDLQFSSVLFSPLTDFVVGGT